MGDKGTWGGKAELARILHKCTFDVFSYKGIVHDVTVICLQNLLKFSDVIILIGTSRERENMHCVTILCTGEKSRLSRIWLLYLITVNSRLATF